MAAYVGSGVNETSPRADDEIRTGQGPTSVCCLGDRRTCMFKDDCVEKGEGGIYMDEHD